MRGSDEDEGEDVSGLRDTETFTSRFVRSGCSMKGECDSRKVLMFAAYPMLVPLTQDGEVYIAKVGHPEFHT